MSEKSFLEFKFDVNGDKRHGDDRMSLDDYDMPRTGATVDDASVQGVQ